MKLRLLEQLKNQSKQLSESPGIYKMLDALGGVLYVGKAKNLRRRVSSYFIFKSDRDPKTRFLVAKIYSIETIITQTEEEALILERQLIQLYQPRYNLALKDDKNYPYIKITKEPFPRVFIVRQRSSDGARYFGPYPSLGSTKRFLRFLHDLFPLRDCKQSIDLVSLQPKCIKLDLGKCIGPCIIKSIHPAYMELVRELALLLSGKSKELMGALTRDMHAYAEALQFEKAAQVRDKVLKLQSLLEQPQRVELETQESFQVWVYFQNDHHHYALIQTFIEGKLLYQKGFYLPKTVEKLCFLEEAILHFMEEDTQKMTHFLCDEAFLTSFQDSKFLELFPKIQTHTPQRGEKKQVLDLAIKNARLAIDRIVERMPTPDVLLALQSALNLAALPKRIMGVDISHLQGTDIVGSVVYFKNGLPYKPMYRRFLVKTVNGESNDPQSIYEVVLRRLKQVLKDQETVPDLFLIDGGKAQLNFAMKAYLELGIQNMTVISLAKREEEVYFFEQSDPLKLPSHHPGLQLLQRVRDEAHRFAGAYQKKLRAEHLKWALSEVNGLGPKRVADLYREYGTLSALAKADPDKLAKLGKLGQTKALQVIAFAQSKEMNGL